jgi:hypothetical protein
MRKIVAQLFISHAPAEPAGEATYDDARTHLSGSGR